MLFKKIVEKYYTDETNTSVNQGNLVNRGVTNVLNQNNVIRNGYSMPHVGFESTSIQKFTFEILEEINEIEEERRKKEMREREELSHLRYLELQRVLYNLQFNKNVEIDRQMKNRLKEMILNMSIDELKNKYKADLNMKYTPAEVYQSQKEEEVKAFSLAESNHKETKADFESEFEGKESSSVSNDLETHVPAATCTLNENENMDHHEVDDLYNSADKRLIDSVENLFEKAEEVDKYIKVYAQSNTVNLSEEEPSVKTELSNKSANVQNDNKIQKVKEISYGKKKQLISIDNVVYPSLKEASAKLNLNKATILWRLKSTNEKFNNYIYVNVDTDLDVDEEDSIHYDEHSSPTFNPSKLAAAA